MTTTQQVLMEIQSRIAVVEETLKVIPELKKNFDNYVTHERFRPIEYIVYGLAGGVLMTILSTILLGVVQPIKTNTKNQSDNTHHEYLIPSYSELVVREVNKNDDSK